MSDSTGTLTTATTATTTSTTDPTTTDPSATRKPRESGPFRVNPVLASRVHQGLAGERCDCERLAIDPVGGEHL